LRYWPLLLLSGILAVVAPVLILHYYTSQNSQAGAASVATTNTTTTVTPSPLKPSHVEVVVRVDCRGADYREKIYYDPRYYAIVKGSWPTISRTLRESLESHLKDYNLTFKVEGVGLDDFTGAVLVEARVEGFVERAGNECRADLSWLLDPLGLDLINSGFAESRDSLRWSGVVRGVSYTVVIELPRQSKVYKAWQVGVGHCHKHVWWPAKP